MRKLSLFASNLNLTHIVTISLWGAAQNLRTVCPTAGSVLCEHIILTKTNRRCYIFTTNYPHNSFESTWGVQHEIVLKNKYKDKIRFQNSNIEICIALGRFTTMPSPIFTKILFATTKKVGKRPRYYIGELCCWFCSLLSFSCPLFLYYNSKTQCAHAIC